jgi:hypothetical protein
MVEVTKHPWRIGRQIRVLALPLNRPARKKPSPLPDDAALNGARVLRRGFGRTRLLQHRVAKTPWTALSPRTKLMIRAAMIRLAELPCCNFSASHTSSNAADIALISSGSNTLSRKRIPSGKNGMIEPICGFPPFSPPMANLISRP